MMLSPWFRGARLLMTEKQEGRAKARPPHKELVSRCTDKGHAALLLGLHQRGCNFLKHSKVLVNICFGVLDGDGPLLVPLVGLGHHAAIDHAEPGVAPQIDSARCPGTVV